MVKTRLKPQLSCFLVATIILAMAMAPVAVGAQEPATKVVIPSVSIKEGASKTVTITIQNTTDAVSSATVKLWFSPAVVNVTGITKGDFPGSFTPNTFYTADGWVKVVVDVGANPSLTSDKIVIANVTLKAVGSAGASSTLGLEVQSLLNDSFVAIPFTPVNGTFEIVAPVITTIAVTPLSVTLNVTDTKVFYATAKDQFGAPMPGINITWTRSNSTVGSVIPMYAITGADGNASTTFTALAAGTTMVNATNATIVGTATVNVTKVKGDVNGDGVVNSGDVTYLARYLAEWPGYITTTARADVTGDGVVNSGDVTYLARYLAEWPGYTV